MSPSSTNIARASAIEDTAEESSCADIHNLMDNGQFVEAAEWCGQRIESHPEDHTPYLALGRLAELAGDDQRSAEFFAEAIVRNTDCGIAYAHLARMFRKLGQLPHAVRALQVAMEMRAAGAGAPLEIADMFFELGDRENARRAYDAVQLKRPDCARSKAMLRLLSAGASPRELPASMALDWSIPDDWRRIHVVIIAPEGNPHWQGFSATASAFAESLRQLGIASTIACNDMVTDAVNVIFGAHLIESDQAAQAIPARSIIFNLEQVTGFGFERRQVYNNILSRFAVWDYSPRNIAKLTELTSNPNIVHVNLGYSPNLASVPISSNQPIDVLFYGSINPRRAAVLEELRAMGLNIKHLFNVYGDALDAEVSRAKVVLNMHFYEDSIHEIVRTSYALANRKAVVSECNANTEIQPDIRGAMRAVPYAGLAAACLDLVHNHDERIALEKSAFACFSKRSQAEFLKMAIDQTIAATVD